MRRLFGLDYRRLPYRYSGGDFRLTDVHGEIVEQVIAQNLDCSEWPQLSFSDELRFCCD